DSSSGLRRLEDSLNIEEHFPDSGVQRDSAQSPELGGFGGFLALAEESFSDLLIPLLIFPEADCSTMPHVLINHMASRGRRGGVPAREGEQRREEQAEQQAPAPQGPVLPPPPPVDYRGLVQAMQTQAHTQAALQAQLEAQERADVWWASLLQTRFEDGAIDIAWDEFEGEMEQYLEEKKASQKMPAAPF
ncbi:hypothetical protein Taro_027131, partial [Colocasia esculenta]|nr:hypothetical protein [Colocasia esculenta]